MQLLIDIPDEMISLIKAKSIECFNVVHYGQVLDAIYNGTIIPKGHGRLGDLDELEQRISNFVEHDARITDEYTVARQRFIVDGIRETPTIIEADKESD